MQTSRSKIRSVAKGIKQRLFYIKNCRYGFSPVFLLPGSMREKLGENTFFKTLTKNNKHIHLEKSGGFHDT